MTTETLAGHLESELGAEAVMFSPSGLDRYAVDGKAPSIWCSPADPAQVSAALRLCVEAHAAVIPWGGGTAMSWGNVPSHADVALSLDRLRSLVEHDDANLTATVQAGMTVAAFQEILTRANQFLAIDPPVPQRATIGGVVAANTNGPRRMMYGGVRDLVIGMKMVLASGEQIKAGGKVVKNVAGYDMCKLFVGSLGTLGIITEVTFKMAPTPETAATVAAYGSPEQAGRLVDAVSASPLLPAAVTILSGGAAAAAGLPADPAAAVLVWAEGFTESVARHAAEIQKMAAAAGMRAVVLDADAHRGVWERVRDVGADGTSPTMFRVTVPLAAVMPVLSAIDHLANGRPVRYLAHAGAGTVWLALDDPAAATTWFPQLIALAAEHRGHAVIAAAPPPVKSTLDVWGPPPPGLTIMREVKRQFDPLGMLNPGRFVGGL